MQEGSLSQLSVEAPPALLLLSTPEPRHGGLCLSFFLLVSAQADRGAVAELSGRLGRSLPRALAAVVAVCVRGDAFGICM